MCVCVRVCCRYWGPVVTSSGACTEVTIATLHRVARERERGRRVKGQKTSNKRLKITGSVKHKMEEEEEDEVENGEEEEEEMENEEDEEEEVENREEEELEAETVDVESTLREEEEEESGDERGGGGGSGEGGLRPLTHAAKGARGVAICGHTPSWISHAHFIEENVASGSQSLHSAPLHPVVACNLRAMGYHSLFPVQVSG